MSPKIMKEDRSKDIVVARFIPIHKYPIKVIASIAISATATPRLTAEQQPAIITDLEDSRWFAIVSLERWPVMLIHFKDGESIGITA